MQTKMLSLREVSERLGRSQGTIRNWVRGTYTKNGKTQLCKTKFVQAYNIGAQYSFRESDVNRWIQEHAEPARD